MLSGMWKQCKVPGCPGLTKRLYCSNHTHLEKQKSQERQKYYNKNIRDTDAQKLYDSQQWRKLRGIHIKKNPLCESCFKKGILTPAIIIDHKVEIKDGGGKLDIDNLQSVCRACHNKKTAQERKKRNDRDI